MYRRSQLMEGRPPRPPNSGGSSSSSRRGLPTTTAPDQRAPPRIGGPGGPYRASKETTVTDVATSITIRRGRRGDAATLAALHREAEWCYDDAAIVTEYFD